jgi:hypothetical protein
VVVFLLTFIKLPLMIYLIGLGTIEIARELGGTRPVGDHRRIMRIVLVLCGAMALFALVQGMMRGGDAQSEPVVVTIREILGRVALSAPSFVHYFPAVEPHYGISGVGLLALLRGEKVYEFTAVVYQYMTDTTYGSSTVCSIIEFYCSFGWPGLVVGNLGVGVLLSELDGAILGLPKGDARLIAQIFAFVFCVQLSQSSIFNASFGYGGFFFFVLWLFIFPRRKRLTTNNRLGTEISVEPSSASNPAPSALGRGSVGRALGR